MWGRGRISTLEGGEVVSLAPRWTRLRSTVIIGVMNRRAIPWDAAIRIRPDVLTRRFDDERIFVDLETSEYFASNRGGDTVWEALARGGTIQNAYDELLATHEVEPAVLRHDLEEFVARLVEAGLVELAEE